MFFRELRLVLGGDWLTESGIAKAEQLEITARTRCYSVAAVESGDVLEHSVKILAQGWDLSSKR
ncbi:hypothetical protein [Serratia inhibens]|uniref:hypothetical protein n=1 Tax=Serratia inhibens TaxID=2338073 RepID=UPI00080932DB|nr:hypothetical protein [Serratia inhibens]ANS44134.1 hypothetical protein Q5A_018510 [Serratia inhibens PRI-2C]